MRHPWAFMKSQALLRQNTEKGCGQKGFTNTGNKDQKISIPSCGTHDQAKAFIRGVTYLEAGMNDFLQKPFVPYRLAMMLDSGDILA